MDNLSPKQQRFVQEYLITLNASEAARRAGYSAKTAHVIGQENLRKPAIQAALRYANEERQRNVQVTPERTLLEIARIAFSDPRKLFDESGQMKEPNEWDDDTAAAIASFEVEELYEGDGMGGKIAIGRAKKVKFWSKTAATDQLGKHLRLFLDHKDQTREISELLKAVLLEFQEHRQMKPAQDAEWTPLHAGQSHRLPPPPPPDEDVPKKETPRW
jgi:phage terminase small subunit